MVEFRLITGIVEGAVERAVAQLRHHGMDEHAIHAVLQQVIEFAYSNLLTIDKIEDGDVVFARHTARARRAWWRQLVDNYLFFRIPLVRPGRFLARTAPSVAWLYSRQSLIAFALLALVNLLLVAREWDMFLATLQEFISWQGVLAYALGLTSVKILHELGHAYTATRYGCRVPSMGVSFLVMFPVLYTDTTSVWKLTSRRKRLAVDCAGVGAELIVASLATSAWLLLPEGALRSVAFVLATSSWLVSLSINLNPFMRFDGYYVLSDLLNMPNLQPRAFALGRWQLREWLFRLGDDPPEDLPRRLRGGMVFYAWLTWAYRFVLFLGIALLVYTMFFKLLGIVLFLVEIGAFILRPMWQEARLWWKRRADVPGGIVRRPWLWLCGFAVLMLFLPLDRHVSGHAVLSPALAQPLVAGSPARIVEIYVTNGQAVRAGTAIAALSRPEAADREAIQQAQIARLEAQLARIPGNAEDLANRAVLERELATARAALVGTRQRDQRLILRAPSDGVVTDLTSDLHAGRWVNGSEVVARVVDPNRWDVLAFVSEEDAKRLVPRAGARFVPDGALLGSRPARVSSISTSAIRTVDPPALASRFGGPILVDPPSEAAQGELRPRVPLYRVQLVTPLDRSSPDFVQPVLGKAIISAEPESVGARWLRQIMIIFRREASIS
jgi:putative peptide zinc metalloprotease protein